MKKTRTIFLLVIFILLGLQGCLPRSTPTPTPQAAPDLSASPPRVRSIEVLQSEVPQQILVIAQAVLPSTCARLGQPSIERQGRVFTISLPGEILTDQVCQTISLSQDKVIRLPAEPLPPGSYIVLVNGTMSTFQVSVPAIAPANPLSVFSGETAAPSKDQAAVNAQVQPTAVAEPTEAAASPEAATSPTAAPTPEAAIPPTPTSTPLQVEAPIVAPTPTAAPLPLAVGDDPADCVNKAAFYANLTIPDGMPFQPGSKFKKTWMVMNAGSCTWGPGYQLVFAGGDPLGSPEKIPLPKASPRQVVQISVDMTAPLAPLQYESRWAFETPEGYAFGLGNPAVTPLLAKISVVALPAGLPSGLDCGALRLREMETQVLEQINTTRAQYGLYPLELKEEISQVALKHSLEMACYNRDAHAGRDGMLYNVRLQRDGIPFASSNEILYAGNGGPSGSILWWMNSTIHRPIVLTTKFTQVGIGYVYFEKNPYKNRITVNFIQP